MQLPTRGEAHIGSEVKEVMEKRKMAKEEARRQADEANNAK